ncbi:MAG TPA: hypothetical protein PK573_02055 [Spirochaetota bacterium]|nr:hypothetical protein [Spirochaetota bacterium]HRZ26387.1 hypothetical protein [Spirochaetota bacterium]
MPSTAAQIIVTIIPIVGIVFGCLVIFFFLFWNHKQKVLLIEKGLYKKADFDLDAFSLFAGLLLTCIGASLLLFFFVMQGFSYGVLSGLIPLATGIGLIIYFSVRMLIKKKNDEKRPGA